VSVENKRSHESDDCPHCQRLLEIAAIRLSLLGWNGALFVCPNCGLARADSPDEAGSLLRHQISALGRMLSKSKYWGQRS
jgi:hypothetical protein